MGRFLNADGFVSTGQGLSGNNMFAYCLNNPTAMADDTGMAAHLVMQVIVFDGVSNKFFQPVTIGSDEWAKLEDLYNKPMADDILETFIDLCHKGATALADKANDIKESDWGQTATGGARIAKGINNIRQGGELILVPCPTAADDALGVLKATKGVIQATYGLVEIVVAWVK